MKVHKSKESIEEQLQMLKNIHEGCEHAGFSSILFIDSLIRWVESGRLLTAGQETAANKIVKALVRFFDRQNQDYEDNDWDWGY